MTTLHRHTAINSMAILSTSPVGLELTPDARKAVSRRVVHEFGEASTMVTTNQPREPTFPFLLIATPPLLSTPANIRRTKKSSLPPLPPLSVSTTPVPRLRKVAPVTPLSSKATPALHTRRTVPLPPMSTGKATPATHARSTVPMPTPVSSRKARPSPATSTKAKRNHRVTIKAPPLCAPQPYTNDKTERESRRILDSPEKSRKNKHPNSKNNKRKLFPHRNQQKAEESDCIAAARQYLNQSMDCSPITPIIRRLSRRGSMSEPENDDAARPLQRQGSYRRNTAIESMALEPSFSKIPSMRSLRSEEDDDDEEESLTSRTIGTTTMTGDDEDEDDYSSSLASEDYDDDASIYISEGYEEDEGDDTSIYASDYDADSSMVESIDSEDNEDNGDESLHQYLDECHYSMELTETDEITASPPIRCPDPKILLRIPTPGEAERSNMASVLGSPRIPTPREAVFVQTWLEMH